MNRSIRTAAVALALAAAPVAVQAQDAGGQGARGERPIAAQMLIRSWEALGLTDAQVERLREIQEDLRARNEPLIARLREAGVAAGSGARAGRGERAGRADGVTPERRAEVRERARERMDALTPEQREAMRERVRERAREMTPEQRAARRERMRERGAAPGARRGPLARGGALPEELRSVVEELRGNALAAAAEARSVLTDEQIERLESLRPDRPARSAR